MVKYRRINFNKELMNEKKQAIILVSLILTILAAVGAGLILGNDRNGEGGGDTGSLVPLPTGFIWFPVGAFLLIAGSQPMYSWVVPYLEQSLDASPSVAGGISAVASAVLPRPCGWGPRGIM